MKKNSRPKGRTPHTYEMKIRRIKKWYAHMVRNRQNTNAKGDIKKPLPPLEFFTDKVQASTN